MAPVGVLESINYTGSVILPLHRVITSPTIPSPRDHFAHDPFSPRDHGVNVMIGALS
jgi:hypothetical protein